MPVNRAADLPQILARAAAGTRGTRHQGQRPADTVAGLAACARCRLTIGVLLLLLAGGCDHEPATPETPAAESAAAVGEDPPAAQDPPATTGTAELVTNTVTTETRFGVPIYPRARRIESGRWKMTDALAEGADALTFIALHTNDELDQVVQFYRRRIDAAPEQSFEIENERGRTVSLTTTADELASVNIILRSRRGEQGTRIEINRLSLDAARATPGK